MGNYVCQGCGQEAYSKCTFQRTVFPADQLEAMYTYVLKRSVEWKGDYTATVTFTVHVELANDDLGNKRSDSAAIKDALDLIAEIPEETRRHYACDHEWEIKPGLTCDFGCCQG